MEHKRENKGFKALAALPWPLGLAPDIAGVVAMLTRGESHA